MPRCPGQDLRFWTAKDIFDVMCFNCGNKIEFWKDEPMRVCTGCGREVRNPRIDLGCAKWCKYAKECIGKAAEDYKPVAPVIDRLELLLEGYFAGEPDAVKRAKRLLDRCEKYLQSEKVDPCMLQTAAMTAGALMKDSVISMDKMASFKGMLERAGIETQAAGQVCEMVYNALNGLDDDRTEAGILKELLALERGK